MFVLHQIRPHPGIKCNVNNTGVEALGIHQQDIGMVDARADQRLRECNCRHHLFRNEVVDSMVRVWV